MTPEHDWQRRAGEWPVETCLLCKTQRRRVEGGPYPYQYKKLAEGASTTQTIFWRVQMREPPCGTPLESPALSALPYMP